MSIHIGYCYILTSWSPVIPSRPMVGVQKNHYGIRYYRYSNGSADLSLPIYLFAIPSLILTLILLSAHDRLRRQNSGTLCPHCGYNLHATPDRCPECGTAPLDVAPPRHRSMPLALALLVPATVCLLWIRSHQTVNTVAFGKDEAFAVRMSDSRVLFMWFQWNAQPPIRTEMNWDGQVRIGTRLPPYVDARVVELPKPNLFNGFGFAVTQIRRTIHIFEDCSYQIDVIAIPFWLPTLLTLFPLTVYLLHRRRPETS
ncbi:MAG TPA: hypothetical protein VF669_02340 [Tepidisphaeraceae bacterium]